MEQQPQVEAVEIRTVRLEDAEDLLALKLALDDETQFMMFEPGERPVDVDGTARELRALLGSENSALIVAEAGGSLIGYVEACGGEFRRNRHAAVVIAGVRQAYAGRGVGSRLFAELTSWADRSGLLRLELTVMTRNAAAIGLYRKVGFEIEGLRRASMLVDGELVEEYLMARVRGDDFAADVPSG